MYIRIAGIPVKLMPEVLDGRPELRAFFLPYSPEPEKNFRDDAGNEAVDPCGEAACLTLTGTTPEDLLRDLSLQLADRGVFLIHGSALALDGRGYLFTAPSGTGKSTHSRLWREVFGERVVMVNDDKPFLRLEHGDRVMVCGSPWNGKHCLGSNFEAPLSGIAVLEQAKENHIRRLMPEDAFQYLYEQMYIPEAPEKARAALQFIADVLSLVPVYLLSCRPDLDAVKTAAEGMKF